MSKISQIKVDNYILNLIITILVVYGIIYLYNLMSNLLFIKFDIWNLLEIGVKLLILVIIPTSYFMCCKLKTKDLPNNIFICGCIINLILSLYKFNININSFITIFKYTCYLVIVLQALRKTIINNYKFFNLLTIITFVFLFIEFLFKLESIIVVFKFNIVNFVLCVLYFIYMCLSMLYFKNHYNLIYNKI